MNEEMGLVMRQQEEREALRSLIAQWNANRLDLFELSEPNEELEFHGVMRFYFQDSGQKVATKCIRVASDASAHAVIETLIEKFRPDMRMLSLPEYALYEIHENGEERRLEDEEKPLLVQLNWHNDDREGRFLLRRIDDKTNYSQMPEGTFQNPSFKRKLSKREKKQLKKQEKLNRLRSTNDENDSGVAEKLYTEKPETSFTRSISNPEAVMRRRRQQKLERKLQLFRSKDGGPDTGGTLKIYGEALCKDVPYKTLLLSIGDTAAMVVKEMLAKYGLDKEDPQHYCLAQVNTAVEETKDSGNNNTAREYILDDDECPLAILMNHPMTRGSIMFHVRRRPADYHPRKRKKKPQTGKWQHNDVIDYNTYQDDRLPFLLELNPDGSEIGGGTAKRYRLQPNVTEVGSERSSALSLQLFGPNVQPRHCVLAHTEGLVTVTPCTRDAETYVNNQRIYETTILQNGCTVKFGRLHTFRFLDPCHEERTRHRHDSARSPHEYSYDRQSGREDASSLSIHGPGETSTPQHEPTPKQPDNTSMNQGPPNYETTFDVEGNVETRSTSSQGNKEDTRSQRSLSSHHSHRLSSYDTRMVRGTEPILPAVLEIREETEEALLHSIITDLEPSCLGFKLAPAYTLYLAARYRASTHYRPELTPTERAHRLTLVMARVANMIHDVIQERYCEVKWLALWLANASELLHFLKSDRHISAFSLDAQDTLADAVQIAFRHLVACLQGELSAVMPNFLSDRDDLSHDPEDSSTASVLGVLCNGMSLLRMCKVNAALTIQLFSQLFNYVNVWAFNRIVGPNSVYCSRAWGLRLKARLAQIEVWAERQGLELAADCHLAKIMQAAHLLQAPKYTCDDLANLSSTYFKLNSLQLRALLQKYQPTPDEPRIPHEIIDSVVRVAENLADELALADGREVRLEEDPELALPFLLPEDGYSCEVVRGVPPGLVDFVAPLQASGLARLTVQPSSNGLWTVYMGPVSTMMQRSASAMSNRSGGFVPSHQEPEVQLIKLHKSNNGMGLSIVAAKGAGQDRLGIYIKSVVKGGAADADGRLQAGDQLLKVDGQSLVGITQEKAAEYLVRTGPVVSLEVAKQGAIYHGLATLLSQPSPLISRGGRRLSERDLPSRVLSDQQSQGGQPLQNRAANHLPPAYPPLHSSKSVPSLNSGSKNEVDRGMLNQTVLGTATIPRQSHEAYNPGYSRTSSTNSISQKGFEQYPNHQIRSRSSQNLTESRGNVPNTLGRGPNIPQYPVGYPPTPTSTAGYPTNSGYHPSTGYPPGTGGYPPGAGYPSTGGFQPQGYSPMYHHVHHQPPSQAQQSASPDQERFYQNLSVYRNHDQHNGFVPGRAKLPSPHDDRSLYQQQQQVNQTQQMQHQQMQQQMQLSQQQQMQLTQQQQQQQQQQQLAGNQRLAAHYTTQVNLTPTANQPGVLHQPDRSETPTNELLVGTSSPQTQQQGLVVNAKTKTALANMLSVRLQGGVVPGGDGTAAGQLRMMTAQHQAQLPPPPPPQPTVPYQQRPTINTVNVTNAINRTSEGVTGIPVVKPPASPVIPPQTPNRVAAVLKSPSGVPPTTLPRSQFFGHNPNLKLPPDMFLLGCVFLIMEYDRSGEDVTVWRRVILENGGETELSYCARVTHILCQTQKHPLVQQGLRDGKRCITAEWLNDVILKQQVIPPWLALHYPTLFSDEKPCRNFIICFSGFEGEERLRIKKMIEAVGAKCTTYYSTHNNILICKKPEGEKYKKAREWGKSVVNVQWLNEILFGHYSCLQHPENQKYQQFNVANPFRIDYTLVPHLMTAWKVPIPVTTECFERAKASGIISPKPKRRRLSSPTPPLSKSNQDNLLFEHSIPPIVNTGRPVVLFSGVKSNASDEEKKVHHLGGVLAKNCREATHLVMDKVQRTVKLLCCLSTCQYIVTTKWLEDSYNAGQFLDEQRYIVDDLEFEKLHNCNILKVLSNTTRSKLFADKIFYITPGVIPSPASLTEMILCAGGTVEKQRRSLKRIQEMDEYTYIVITTRNDMHLIIDLIRSNFGIYATEFVMTGILTQKIPYETVYKRSIQKKL